MSQPANPGARLFSLAKNVELRTCSVCGGFVAIYGYVTTYGERLNGIGWPLCYPCYGTCLAMDAEDQLRAMAEPHK